MVAGVGFEPTTFGYEKTNNSNNNDLRAVTGKQKPDEGTLRKGREVLVWG
jgi:hypothetical protein